ncbi:uncharacterized protein [Primulina huaijiensis]|uniref:uncharacterized protein n=1 Tax=Primulina huaijiensis TaxID=1492673 RepID=UPI003CC766C3
MVISWILNSVSKEILASIIFAESALEIWQDLKDRFQQSNGPRIFQLRRELINHRQGQTSVSVYFTKLKTIWEELNNFRPQCVCGNCCEGIKKLELHHQMDYVLAFFMGLNESFSQVRSQILLIDPLPPINKVFSMIVQEERQRQIGSQVTPTYSTDGMTFAIKGEPTKFSNGEPTKFSAESMGSVAKGKPRPNFRSYPKERPFCTACNMHGHTLDTCYKIHGYPPGFKSKPRHQFPTQTHQIHQVSGTSVSEAEINVSSNNNGQFFQSLNKDQYGQLMTMFANHLSSTMTRPHDSSNTSHSSGTCLSISVPHSLMSSSSWIMDSGASRHICSNPKDFISMRPIQNSVVTLPNHTHVSVASYGDVKISDTLIIRDVLFVPEFKFNLFSVGSFIAHNEVVISFFHDQFVIQDLSLKKMIGKGRRVENLYVLEATKASEFPTNTVSVQEWHNRLGHPSNNILECLQSRLNCQKVNFDNVKPCYICPLAKQRRLSFVSNHHMSASPFDLIHCDI